MPTRPSTTAAMKRMEKKTSKPSPTRRREKPAPAEPQPPTAPASRVALPIVGIAASADGLEALERFLKHIPADSGLAFVIAQHLDPTRKGLMVEILQRSTPMKVLQVKNRTRVQPNRVYVIPPNKDMSILHGVLHLFQPAASRGLRLPIHFFFRSLAQDQQHQSIALILSGMGSDGTLGLRDIKENAGLTLTQEPASAKFDSMPRSVIEAGLADVVAPAEDLPARIIDITARKQAVSQLHISEIRYRRLFEAAHDGVLLLDPATCKIIEANPFMTRLLGYPRDELLGKELFEIGLLKDEAASRAMFQQLKKNHEIRYENLPLANRDGRHQEVEVVANLYQENASAVIQCNIRDITARKHAEEALRRNEALLTTLIEQAPVGVYVVDARFRLQQVNPMAMPVFSQVQPLLGRDFAEIMHLVWPRRVADEIVTRFRHTLQTGEDYQAVGFAERRRDTRVKEHYEWQIQRVTLPAGEFGVVCFFSNITARIKAESAHRRLDVLTASNIKLRREIVRRQAVEQALQQTEQQLRQLLTQSRLQQKQLRELSHRILHAQEEERKRISRELHDVIAQSLVGIKIHVAALSQAATTNPRTFQQKIARARTMVGKAVDIVHEFARELRPTMLDDLGLIPALQAHLQEFMENTGIRASLKVIAGIEQAPAAVRTALYRVAQEALTNVVRHAKASKVEVSIQRHDGTTRMEIRDNGQGFDVERTTRSKKNHHLGLLGMKERVEMIGGTFRVSSAPGHPTTVQVAFPNKPGGARQAGNVGLYPMDLQPPRPDI